MAYIFADGFDNYTNPGDLWDSVIGGSIQNTNPSPRFPNPAGAVSQYLVLGNAASARKNFANTGTIITGFAFRTAGLPSSPREIIVLEDNAVFQVSLVLNSAGALQFWRGNTPIGSITPNAIIGINVWYELAVVVTIDGAAGAVTCYLNGNSTPIINSSGLNTRQTTNNYCNQLLVNNMPNTSFFDDVYVFDTTGTANNAWPGNDVRIITKLPTGAGTYTNWTPNGLGTNWQCVSQTPPNIADYVANNTPGTKDSYTTTAVGLNVTPYAVVVRQSITKDDGNTHTAQALVRSGGQDATGTAYTVNSSYAVVDTLFPTDPNTTLPWTAAAADATQIGVVETS